MPLSLSGEPVPFPDVTAPGPAETSPVAGISGRLSAEATAAAEDGIQALAKNKFGDAEKDFQKLLKLSPDNPSGLVNLGLVEFRWGARKRHKNTLSGQPG